MLTARGARLALALGLLQTGCVAVAARIGGADGLGQHRKGTPAGSAPIYDCRPRWFDNGTVCTPRPVEPPPPRPVLAPAQPPTTTRSADGKLSLRMNVSGGALQVTGHAARHPTRVLVALRPSARMEPAPCRGTLFRDGRALTTYEQARTSDRELLVAIGVSDLRGLERAVRVSARACGRSLELDATARTALSEFEARFREELVSK